MTKSNSNSPTNGDDDDSSNRPSMGTFDGFMASLSSILPLPNTLTDLMDEQRRSRLSQCRELDQVLSDCRKQRPDRAQLEDFPMGIRMVRYFDWRNRNDGADCVREEHALWACRAVGLQCGPDLVKMRDCFKQQQSLILQQTETAYEIKEQQQETNKNLACFELQSQLGACVKQKATALEARMREKKD